MAKVRNNVVFTLKWMSLIAIVAIIITGCSNIQPFKKWQLNNISNAPTFYALHNDNIIQEVKCEYSNLKILTSEFYSYNGHDYIIAGTEIPKNTFNENSGIIFVYDISVEAMLLCEQISGLASMTSIYRHNDYIYLGGISIDNKEGCMLFRYSIANNKLESWIHYPSRGIWALTGDNENTLYVATSDPIALYSVNILNANSSIIADGFTDKTFIRSISYDSGYCYLGMGTNAGMLKIDVVNGNYQQILPDQYMSDAFVYAQCRSGDRLYILMSPSYKILSYDLNDGVFSDTGFYYDPENISEKIRLCDKKKGGEVVISLLGNLFCISESEGQILEQKQFGTVLSAQSRTNHYGLDSSGILRVGTTHQIDLFELVDDYTIVPNHYLVDDDRMIIAERRFANNNLSDGHKRIFLIKDEPQAVICNTKGVYTANYTECTLYFYSWEDLESQSYSIDMNSPKFFLADIVNQCRPHDLFLEKNVLLLASGPLYGNYGGAISCYDIDRDRLIYTDYDTLPKGQSPSSFGYSDKNNCVWIGTTCYGENTTPPTVNTPAHLVLYNYNEKKILMDIIPNKDNKSIGSIVESDNVVFCVLRYGRLMGFNKTTGECIFDTCDSINVRQIIKTQNGVVLVVSNDTIWSITENLEIKKLIKGFQNISNAVEDKVTGQLYFYDNDRLFKIKTSILRGLVHE